MKSNWNQFILQNKGSFLQSEEWNEFQKSIGRQTWQIEGDGYKGLVVQHDLPLGKSYLYCPQGPVFEEGKDSIEDFIGRVKTIEGKNIFFKIDSLDKDIDFSSIGFKKSIKEIQPSKTIILDISQSEDDILSQMHQKTRYNIRLAQKRGVTFKESEEIDVFWKLLEETSKRDKFFTHSKEYYSELMKIDFVHLFLAYYQGKPIVGSLVLFWGNKAIYLHGASSYENRNVMAPHLMQWQNILEAKRRNLKYYDFWGIDEKKWPGVTRFKRGFGGKEIFYPGSFDLPLSKLWYLLYCTRQKLKLTLKM